MAGLVASSAHGTALARPDLGQRACSERSEALALL